MAKQVYEKTQRKGVKIVDWIQTESFLSQLLIADDTVLVAELTEQLQCLVKEFGRICERKILRENPEKIMATVVGREWPAP